MEQSLPLEMMVEIILNIYRHRQQLYDFLDPQDEYERRQIHNDIPESHVKRVINDFHDPNTLWRYYLCIRRPYELGRLADHLVGKEGLSPFEIRRAFLRIDQDLSREEYDINDEEILRQEVLIRQKMLEIDQAEAQQKLQSFDQNMHDKFKINQDLIDQHKTQLSELEHQNQEVREKYQYIEKAFKEFEKKHAAYNEVVDVDSNGRLKKLYDDIYVQEITLADDYRKWALWIFAAVGGFLLIGFLIVSVQNWNHLRNPSFIEIKLGWDSLFKTLMLFSLTTPAWYLTKESSKHRQVAYKAKMLGTELAAFPLYAREFKDEERLELRKRLADRFFGQELYGASNSKSDNSASSTEQIKLLAEMNKVTVEAIKVQQTLLGKKG